MIDSINALRQAETTKRILVDLGKKLAYIAENPTQLITGWEMDCFCYAKKIPLQLMTGAMIIQSQESFTTPAVKYSTVFQQMCSAVPPSALHDADGMYVSID